jgi:hypothetical protein
MKNPSVALFSAALFFATTSPAATDGWELIDQEASDRGGWALYGREKEGSEVNEYKVTGLIEAPPQIALRAAREALFNEKYLPDNQKVTILERSEERVLTYTVTEMPGLFSDRDAVIEYVFFERVGLGTFGVTWSVAPNGGPAKPEGVVRIPRLSGGWEFAADGSGRTLATCVAHADIGGNIPAWLVNRLAGDHMVQDLDNMRKLAASLK